MSESLLTAINRIMNDGMDGCPSGAVSLGECALIEHEQGNRWSAEVILWQESTTISTVAGWFASQGCRDVSITQYMHDDRDRCTREGVDTEDKTRHLVVSFLRDVDDRPMIDRVKQAKRERERTAEQLRMLMHYATKRFNGPTHAPSTLVLHTGFAIDAVASQCDRLHTAIHNGIALTPPALDQIATGLALALDQARAYLAGLKALMREDAEREADIASMLDEKHEPPL